MYDHVTATPSEQDQFWEWCQEAYAQEGGRQQPGPATVVLSLITIGPGETISAWQLSISNPLQFTTELGKPKNRACASCRALTCVRCIWPVTHKTKEQQQWRGGHLFPQQRQQEQHLPQCYPQLEEPPHCMGPSSYTFLHTPRTGWMLKSTEHLSCICGVYGEGGTSTLTSDQFQKNGNPASMANAPFGPVYMSKIYLSDGFYRVQINPTDIMKLGVLFPSQEGGGSPHWHSPHQPHRLEIQSSQLLCMYRNHCRSGQRHAAQRWTSPAT
eukprot:jgi/Psemu1/34501/gm1.34501_g